MRIRQRGRKGEIESETLIMGTVTRDSDFGAATVGDVDEDSWVFAVSADCNDVRDEKDAFRAMANEGPPDTASTPVKSSEEYELVSFLPRRWRP